jgi:hypothetical protein
MTQHSLQGRLEHEVTWFQRRSFLQAAAAWTALGGYGAAQAQSRSNVVQLLGEATLNGARLLPGQHIQTGDSIVTGPNSTLVFVLGTSAFHVRQNSHLAVERGATLSAVSILRLLTGAVASVWGTGGDRKIVTPTMTAGIRGTGVYTEVFPERDKRTYFCNCYGTVDVSAGNESVVSQSEYHQAYWGEPAPVDGRLLRPAGAINHTDEELEHLALLANRRTSWQLSGRKGKRDGMGYMNESPGQKHPLQMPRK